MLSVDTKSWLERKTYLDCHSCMHGSMVVEFATQRHYIITYEERKEGSNSHGNNNE